MKKLFFLITPFVFAGLAHSATITAPSSLIGTGELNGQDAYSWGISIALPSGQQVISASINFTDITLTEADPNGVGVLYTDLLNSKNTGVKVISEGDTSSDYWNTVYSGANIMNLGKETFPSVNSSESWSYGFNAADLSSLNAYLTDNNGIFNFGIDPNCMFTGGSISFTYTLGNTPRTVPDAAVSVSLLVLGLAGIELFRRRMAVRSVNA